MNQPIINNEEHGKPDAIIALLSRRFGSWRVRPGCPAVLQLMLAARPLTSDHTNFR